MYILRMMICSIAYCANLVDTTLARSSLIIVFSKCRSEYKCAAGSNFLRHRHQYILPGCVFNYYDECMIGCLRPSRSVIGDPSDGRRPFTVEFDSFLLDALLQASPVEEEEKDAPPVGPLPLVAFFERRLRTLATSGKTLHVVMSQELDDLWPTATLRFARRVLLSHIRNLVRDKSAGLSLIVTSLSGRSNKDDLLVTHLNETLPMCFLMENPDNLADNLLRRRSLFHCLGEGLADAVTSLEAIQYAMLHIKIRVLLARVPVVHFSDVSLSGATMSGVNQFFYGDWSALEQHLDHWTPLIFGPVASSDQGATMGSSMIRQPEAASDQSEEQFVESSPQQAMPTIPSSRMIHPAGRVAMIEAESVAEASVRVDASRLPQPELEFGENAFDVIDRDNMLNALQDDSEPDSAVGQRVVPLTHRNVSVLPTASIQPDSNSMDESLSTTACNGPTRYLSIGQILKDAVSRATREGRISTAARQVWELHSLIIQTVPLSLRALAPITGDWHQLALVVEEVLSVALEIMDASVFQSQTGSLMVVDEACIDAYDPRLLAFLSLPKHRKATQCAMKIRQDQVTSDEDRLPWDMALMPAQPSFGQTDASKKAINNYLPGLRETKMFRALEDAGIDWGIAKAVFTVQSAADGGDYGQLHGIGTAGIDPPRQFYHFCDGPLLGMVREDSQELHNRHWHSNRPLSMVDWYKQLGLEKERESSSNPSWMDKLTPVRS